MHGLGFGDIAYDFFNYISIYKYENPILKNLFYLNLNLRLDMK